MIHYTAINAKILSANESAVVDKINSRELNMGSNHAAGIYFLNITTNNGKSTILKIMKK